MTRCSWCNKIVSELEAAKRRFNTGGCACGGVLLPCCDQCGGALRVGDYPFCHGDPAKHQRAVNSVISDECDITVENGFHTPQRFTSKADHRRALAAKGLEVNVRHVPIPGTDYSPHTTDWSRGSVDLEAAIALVQPRGRVNCGQPVDTSDVPMAWTISEKNA